mgnify:CR=1 FL=1
MLINFTKMHGAGNDFIVIDDRDDSFKSSESELAKRLCHRRFSVGADGIIFLRRGISTESLVSMHYFNADGSYAGMCGNGIRVTAWYFYKRIDDSHDSFFIDVDGEPRAVTVKQETELRAMVSVNMGVPSLKLWEIPAVVNGKSLEDEHIDSPIALLPDYAPNCTLVSMGNPHCVIFVHPDEITDELVLGRGREIERAIYIFPERVNVEFAVIHEGKTDTDLEGPFVTARVYERGVGETWACASGASAIVVAGVLAGKLPMGKEIPVSLLGGTLLVSFEGRGSPVYLRGPAEFSFEGSVEV